MLLLPLFIGFGADWGRKRNLIALRHDAVLLLQLLPPPATTALLGVGVVVVTAAVVCTHTRISSKGVRPARCSPTRDPLKVWRADGSHCAARSIQPARNAMRTLRLLVMMRSKRHGMYIYTSATQLPKALSRHLQDYCSIGVTTRPQAVTITSPLAFGSCLTTCIFHGTAFDFHQSLFCYHIEPILCA